MTKYQNTFRIESARLKERDYSNPWWYYVTINTKNHAKYFGNVINEKMILDKLGNIADQSWKDIPTHFKNIELDYYVIMPNHIHGILILNECCRDAACNVSTSNRYSEISPQSNSLSVVIRSFKSAVTKRIHEIGYNSFVWQSRFYDHIIRNEKELFNIRKYIVQNPLKWDLGKNQTENISEL
ncbi:MAG: transposase [Bacteroidota bacterium]